MTTFKLLAIALALIVLVLIVRNLSTNQDTDDQPTMRSSQSPDSSAAVAQGGASDEGLDGELAELDRELNKTQEDVDGLQQPERSRELKYDEPNEPEEDVVDEGAVPVNPVDRRVAEETGELADKLNSFAEGVEEEFQGEDLP